MKHTRLETYSPPAGWLRDVIIEDLKEAVARCDAAASDMMWKPLGDTISERAWRAVLDEMKAMENTDG